jgi:hypothetical protein
MKRKRRNRTFYEAIKIEIMMWRRQTTQGRCTDFATNQMGLLNQKDDDHAMKN